jgi:hypothetical protein
MAAQTFRTTQHGQTRGGVERLLVEEAGEVEDSVHSGIVREDEGEVEGSCIGVLWLPYSQIVINEGPYREATDFFPARESCFCNKLPVSVPSFYFFYPADLSYAPRFFFLIFLRDLLPFLITPLTCHHRI